MHNEQREDPFFDETQLYFYRIPVRHHVLQLYTFHSFFKILVLNTRLLMGGVFVNEEFAHCFQNHTFRILFWFQAEPLLDT